MIDHVQMHGAKRAILSTIVDVICTCCISLVARVMRDDVLNSSISALENDITFLKRRDLRSFPMPAPTLAARSDTSVVNAITATDIRSISPPILNMNLF